MKLSLNWLKQYIDLDDINIKELSNVITMSTCEIEDVYDIFDFHENIVVGKVLECKPHPDNEKLTICKVHDGNDTIQVLCGASNIKEDVHVVLAKVGSKLKIQEEFLTIEKKQIKGVDSYGMICSSVELGIDMILGDNGRILILDDLPDEVFEFAYSKKQKSNQKPESIEKIKPSYLKPGIPIKEIFPYKDTIIDIDNKSITHRPDLWGHFGFAMELSAILKRKIHYNPLKEFKKIKQDPKLPSKEIKIKNHSALAYNGIVCTNIEVKPSPLWLRILLSSIGQKTINNIVDISNYVMYDLGQPNHAFDLKELRSDKIICDVSPTEMEFTALDQVTYKVPAGSIIIYDGEEPVALGGVIGGLHSSIKDDTTEIFIESATFPRELIRKTISATGLRTESARRFEKGLDPAKSKVAIFRFIELLKESCPRLKTGKLESHFTVEEIKNNKIKTTIDFIQLKLGFSIKPKEVKEILERLHFKVKMKKDQIEIIVPSFRSYYDITIPEDIVEEIGRIYGYDNIEPKSPLVKIQKPNLPYDRYFERQLKYFITTYGKFYETMNYSFARKEDNEIFGYEGIQLKNPAQKQNDRLRVSQIPGLLEQVKLNIHRYEDAGLFELGRIFIPKNKTSDNLKELLPNEIRKLTIVYFSENLKNFSQYLKAGDDERLGLFLYLRHLMENLLRYFHIEFELKIPDTKYLYLHPNCQLDFYHKNQIIGHIGLLHPSWYQKYDFPFSKTIVLADFNYDLLFSIWNQKREQKETYYVPPSNFPKSTFDFTILMKQEDSTFTPISLIQNLYKEFQEIELVDIYMGEPIPKDQKSVTYRVHCIDMKPITNERLQEMLNHVVKVLDSNGYSLRV